MLTILHKRSTLALCLTLTGSAIAPLTPALADTFGGMNPVSNQELGKIRGGFATHFDLGQLKLTLDLSHLSFINGNPAPGRQFAGENGGMLNLIQNGLGNTVSPATANNISSGAVGTIVQNSLDNQTIQTLNVLNLTVTSQALIRASAVQGIAGSALLHFM